MWFGTHIALYLYFGNVLPNLWLSPVDYASCSTEYIMKYNKLGCYNLLCHDIDALFVVVALPRRAELSARSWKALDNLTA
jgi:hypothetical protein